MDLDTVSPDVFGASLSGIGLNLLVRDTIVEAAFLEAVFAMQKYRVSADYAILTYHGHILQLHADHTYAGNPLLGVVAGQPSRGAGAEFRLYETDPDEAVGRAHALGAEVLQEPTDKPHGLRETYILCPNGYAWVASRAL
jgi:hypothetical protein